MTTADPPDAHAQARIRVIKPLELFIAFATVGMCGFGGVMPWARRVVVEQRRWLSEEEFVNMLSLCQFLPGGNIMNLSVCIGSRFAGLRGALAAFTGLMMMPVLIVLVLAQMYGRYGDAEVVQAAFRGVASSAAGLIVAMGLRFAWPARNNPRAIAFVMIVLVAVLVVKVPLLWILLGLVPLSIFAAAAFER